MGRWPPPPLVSLQGALPTHSSELLGAAPPGPASTPPAMKSRNVQGRRGRSPVTTAPSVPSMKGDDRQERRDCEIEQQERLELTNTDTG
ncbi:endothelial PAS domain-containing protein 1-like isoform X2 [Moschus berezovskii]|uniref:endothelial PAS domain-containing protein 1-like isoform X2 n=1 Tax=Moschus berezovskii TaxID=68408 RepID=UPI0024441213|nr:endothelial PAS domain-containing protein 1-like isoform X2 [Moschus berezovskii]